jgi:hypothetical protein
LLAAVDRAISSKHKRLSGFRYVDDYEFYSDSLHEAEDILQTIELLLGGYELLLNPHKTSISELPAALEDQWHVELAHFPIRASGTSVAFLNDLIAFFSRAFEFAGSQPQAAILKYALIRISAFNLNTTHWRTIQGLLCAAVAAEPSALPACVPLMVQAKIAGMAIASDILGATLESTILRATKVGHAGEVAWALWCAMSVGLPLGKDATHALSRMEDDVVALLALHAVKRGLLPKHALDLTTWQTLIDTPEVSISEHWLLGYEASMKQWLTPTKYLSSTFKAMQNAKVRFYAAQTSPSAMPAAARALPGGTLAIGYF